MLIHKLVEIFHWFPYQKIDKMYGRLKGAKYFTTLDL